MLDLNMMKDTRYIEKLVNLHSDKAIRRYLQQMMQKIVSLLPKDHLEIIYDIGCGTGNISSLFMQYFPSSKVYSFDYVKHNLDYGVKAKLISNPILSNIYELEAHVNSSNLELADVVFFGDVIEHLENVPLALKNISSVMKTGSKLIIHTPNSDYSKFFHLPEDPTHFHEFSIAELRSAIDSNGLVVDQYFPTGIPGLNMVSPSLAQRLAYSSLMSTIFNHISILGPSIFLLASKK